MGIDQGDEFQAHFRDFRVTIHKRISCKAKMDIVRFYPHSAKLFFKQFNGIGYKFRGAPFIIGIYPSVGMGHHICITWITAAVPAALDVVNTVKAETTFIE